MNLKSKLFGFGAATVLSLSMVSGAMAAPGDDSVDGSVVLDPTYCVATIDQGNVSFGTWTWNDEIQEYQHTGGSNVQTLSGKLRVGKPDGTCDLKVTFAGLENGGQVIDATHFSIVGAPAGSVLNPISAVISGWLAGGVAANDIPRGEGDVQLMLNSVPDDYQPGTYSGTLSVDITNTD